MERNVTFFAFIMIYQSYYVKDSFHLIVFQSVHR